MQDNAPAVSRQARNHQLTIRMPLRVRRLLDRQAKCDQESVTGCRQQDQRPALRGQGAGVKHLSQLSGRARRRPRLLAEVLRRSVVYLRHEPQSRHAERLHREGLATAVASKWNFLDLGAAATSSPLENLAHLGVFVASTNADRDRAVRLHQRALAENRRLRARTSSRGEKRPSTRARLL